MPYPTIGTSEARLYLQITDAIPEGEDHSIDVPQSQQASNGSEEDWDALGAEVAAKLQALMQASGKEGEVKGSEFEAAAGPEIHRILPKHPALADPEFWVWLTLTFCQSIVDWRYPGKRNLKNFGIGGAAENLLYRLWLRAEIAHVPEAKDEYQLARFGDIDFWRSHIFRQGYGEVRPFVHALIGFQFPSKGGHKSRLKINDIRALAKQLKRARTNLMFEVMSEKRAAQFIESEWERLESQAA